MSEVTRGLSDRITIRRKEDEEGRGLIEIEIAQRHGPPDRIVLQAVRASAFTFKVGEGNALIFETTNKENS